MINRHRHHRNSTIKQEQQQLNNHGLQNDSSISMHSNDEAHYYDLDYSDENMNEGIVSSSDENERQITHQEFMQMIINNQQRHRTSSDGDVYEEESPQHQNFYYQNKYQHNISKNVHSHEFKRQQNKRHTPETRDKSFSYGMNKINKEVRNDPEKSSFIKNQLKLSKQGSFNNHQNSVKQFRIDSFINANSQFPKQIKIQKIRKQKRPQIFQKTQQDQSFSLITLPQYDEQSYSSIAEKQNINENKEFKQKKRNLSKYQNIGKLRTQQDNHYQKLNWRYQQAKLKFMDNFLPDPLKIGSNSYNMFKYINKKQQLAFNILKM